MLSICSHRARFVLARASVAGSLLAATACTKFASESDTSDGAIATGLLSSDPSWACVEEEDTATDIMPANSPPLDYAVTALDFTSGMTPTNLLIRACFRGDIECTRPATAQLGPDENGVVLLPLTVGFNGYLEITSDDMVPTLFVFPDSLSAELVELVGPMPVPLLPYDVLIALGQSSQLMLDPAAGVISMNVYDCLGPGAAGVRLELNASAVPFAFVDGLPLAFQDTTTAEGTAGFANVLPGLVVVRAFRSASVDLVGLETVLVRTGWVTVGNMLPQFARQP